MKTLTFEEMKERFPVKWYYDGSKFIETFHLSDEGNGICNTYEECLAKTIDTQLKARDKELNRVNGIANEVKSRSGIFYHLKRKFKRAYKARLEEIESQLEERVSYIKGSEKSLLSSESNYTIDLDCQVGDVLWIAVEKNNSLKMGVHKALVTEVSPYFNRESFNINVRAIFETYGGERFTLRVGDTGLTNDWTYHYIFTSKQEAVEAMSAFIQIDIDELNKLKEKIEGGVLNATNQ